MITIKEQNPNGNRKENAIGVRPTQLTERYLYE